MPVMTLLCSRRLYTVGVLVNAVGLMLLREVQCFVRNLQNSEIHFVGRASDCSTRLSV